jgi:hypothetical protein
MDTGHPGCVRRLLPKNLAKDAPFYAGYGKTKNTGIPPKNRMLITVLSSNTIR